MVIIGPSAFGAMGLMPAIPVRCSSCGLTGGRRDVPNLEPPPDCCVGFAAAEMEGKEGEGAELGMMRAGGDWGFEKEGEPEALVVWTTGGEGAAMLPGVAKGEGERATLDVESCLTCPRF
jgi:hypothetical protein